MTNTWSP